MWAGCTFPAMARKARKAPPAPPTPPTPPAHSAPSAPQTGRFQRLLDNSGTAAFFGAIVGGVLTACAALMVVTIQELGETSRLEVQLDEEDRDAQAAVRLEAYKTYLSSADHFKASASSRVTTCKPGTDTPLHEGTPCFHSSNDQMARSSLQAAAKEMDRVASQDALSAMEVIASAMPSLDIPSNGVPEEGMPDEEKFSRGYRQLQDVMKCETVPVPDPQCPTEQG